MRLLVVSDTHENVRAVDELLRIADMENVDAIIHCGDFISPIIIRRLLKFDKEIYGVWGNNDGDKDTIFHLIKNSKITIENQPREIKIGDSKALIAHGWRSVEMTLRFIRLLALSGEYKYIFYGHTHNIELSIVKNNKYKTLQKSFEKDSSYSLRLDEFDTLVLNPGEASGILRGIPTYAIIDIYADKVVIRIEKMKI